MRSFSLAVSLIVGGIALFASAPAFAVCNPSTTTEVSCLKAADRSCSQLGTSMMDKDQKNIIACLRNDSGTLEWKAMTVSSPVIVTTTGTVNNGDNIPVPAGKNKENCSMMLIPEDVHSGTSYNSAFGDSVWGDNHYAGVQSYINYTSMKAVCRFGITYWDHEDPSWYSGSCRYHIVCL